MKLEVNATISNPCVDDRLRRIEALVYQILANQRKFMPTIGELQTEVVQLRNSVQENGTQIDTLNAKVAETVGTLGRLVVAIEALEQNSDPAAIQAVIDLAREAKTVVDASTQKVVDAASALGSAEDAADDKAPEPPAAPV